MDDASCSINACDFGGKRRDKRGGGNFSQFYSSASGLTSNSWRSSASRLFRVRLAGYETYSPPPLRPRRRSGAPETPMQQQKFNPGAAAWRCSEAVNQAVVRAQPLARIRYEVVADGVRCCEYMAVFSGVLRYGSTVSVLSGGVIICYTLKIRHAR